MSIINLERLNLALQKMDYLDKNKFSQEHPREAFLAHLQECGFQAPEILKDGAFDRIRDAQDLESGNKSKKSGWYIYNQYEQIAIATYGSFHGHPEKETWISKNHQYLDREELEIFEKTRRANEERQRLEQAKEHAKVAKESYDFIISLQDATDENPYLKRKQVKAFSGVKAIDDLLIVPITCDDEITSTQTIYADGTKKMRSGGRKKGCYFELSGDDSIIYICEGYATGASIHEASKSTVFIAFDAYNLYEVFSKIKSKYPQSLIVMAGENNDTSRSKLNNILTDNVFPPDGECDDLNDYHVKHGLKALSNLLKPKKKKIEEESTETTNEKEFQFSGFLGNIIDYYNSTSGNHQPYFAIQTALAIGSILLARVFKTNLDNKSSVMFLNIGKTATGKEHSKTVIKKILKKTNNQHLLLGEGYTSGSAVICALEQKPRHITIIDEFSKYLEQANNPNANGILKTTNTKLMETTTSLCSSVTSMSYSTRGVAKNKEKDLKPKIIESPAITLLAISTPDDLFNSIDVRSINDGFLNRFIICISDAKRTTRIDKEEIEVPQSIIDFDLEIKKRIGEQIEIATEEPKEIIIKFNFDAIQLKNEYDEKCIKLMNSLDRVGLSNIVGRAKELAMRLSLIIALSNDAHAKIINGEDMRLAIEYVDFNLQRLIKKLKASVSGSKYESDKKKILEAIKHFKNEGIRLSEIPKTPPFSQFKKRDLEEILQSLQQANLIEKTVVTHDDGKGRPYSLWRYLSKKERLNNV